MRVYLFYSHIYILYYIHIRVKKYFYCFLYNVNLKKKKCIGVTNTNERARITSC